VAIALDRMEKGTGELSAVQEVRQNYGIPVIAIASLDDLILYLTNEGGMTGELAAVERYRDRYGVSSNA
jgi:orotate phosphoribosyltransferase